MVKFLLSFRFSPYVFEAAIVFATLSFSAYLGGGKVSDWLSAIAVFLSFSCTQVSFDMAESSSEKSRGSRYQRLYLTKELFWIAACLALQNYPLIASTIVFASYPYWRALVRNPSLIKDLRAARHSIHDITIVRA